MFVQQLVLYLCAAGFAAMGLIAILKPDRVTRQFGIAKLTLAGRNEVRAVYGGFGVAVALMLVVATRSSELRPGICFTSAAALAGMAAGRIVSAGMDRGIERFPLVYLIIEAAFAAALAWVANWS